MKTKKQAAKEFAIERVCAACTKRTNINCDDKGHKCTDARILYNAFIGGVEWSNRWISVEEELPESGQVVLCKRDHKDPDEIEYFVSQYVDDMFYINDNEVLNETDEPTHWRPIKTE